MDSRAIAPLPAAHPGPVATAPGTADGGALTRLAALPARSRLALGVGVAALLAVLVALALWGRQGDWRVLYANLSDQDGGAVVAQLSQMGVPYRHAEGGGAILVPAERVHDTRLRLASAGLPRGSVVGFELMDNARFGQTQFQERLTFQRGLEGELTRSIGALAAVQSARVHLALPNQTGFFREQQKPSASVLLTLHPGRSLERAQIAGIVHLVSSSVPEMNPRAVSVLDQTGALLSGPDESLAQQGLDTQQLQHVQQVEQAYLRRIVALLEPIVGRENLRATVTADVDFSQTESTSQTFGPNQGDAPAAVRSQQISESGAVAPAVPSGVPGAASNTPPTPTSAPINAPAAPLQAAPTGGGGATTRRDQVTNFEVDKTVRVTRAATGTVRRVNAAVVVNHRTTTDARGRETTQALPQEEIDKLTALVQESIGFSRERGDSVRVISAPFRTPVVAEPAPLPLWQQPWLHDLLRTAALPLALALVAAVVVFGVLRPALKSLAPAAGPAKPARGTQVDTVVGDGPGAGSALPALEAPRSDERLERARQLARDNPVAVAGIVRGWVGGAAT
jgi:flagellar M-ring protein FliF